MHALKRLRKLSLSLLALFLVFDIGTWNSLTVSANPGSSSSVDLLDPDFIRDHGGNFVKLNAVEGRSPYDVFGEAFHTDNPVEGATKFAREKVPEAARHVENVYDAKLNKQVWKVEANGNDCYTCYLHNATWNQATGKFEGGNDDRQRIEIRPDDEAMDRIGLENDITAYQWKLKIDKDINIVRPSGFFHIFQYKAVNAYGRVGDSLPLHDVANYPNHSSDEDGNPILTLTISNSSTQNLEFRYADIGSVSGQETLARVPLNSVKDRWLDITVKILNSEYGWVTMVMKDVETGEVLMEYNNPNRVLDMWRRPEVRYNGVVFEGPYPAVSNMINRPKWGIYRRADKTDPTVPDAKIYLADMTLYKSAVNVSSSNLAYNKKAYNVGPVSGNAFQTANAKAERLVDGVQIDPVKYTNLTVPQATYNALGILSWIGTESSKKGNVVIDLGKPMDFNQLKVTAKTARLKYVNVAVSDVVYNVPEAEIEGIRFTPVDPLYNDNGKGWTYFNEANNGGDDAADKEYLIDLGKSYKSRYVRVYLENGSGSNGSGTTNGVPTFTMTGPPRITELEIYNAPQTPKNLQINYSGGSTATISWDPIPSDYFVIYDNGNVLVDRAASNPYTLTGLDPGATYKLSVRNVYTDPQSFKLMTSAESEIKTLQTSGDPIVPNPPSSVAATVTSEKSINVNWEETSDAQSYRVALATDAYERIVADNVKGASFSIRDLSPGTTYKVKVYTIRRGIVSAVAAESQVTTAGIKHPSDNLLFNKEVQYTRVWNDDVGSYGAHRALDNNTDSRWVALKGSRTAWMMVDIGEITPVSTLEYYSFQNRLKKVSFYYATDAEAFKDPNSDKWIKILTDDRVAQGKFGNPAIAKIEESIPLAAPVNARFIKFTVDDVDGDINVNEVKAFGPISFTGNSALTSTEKTDRTVLLSWEGSGTTIPASGYEIYSDNNKLATVAGNVYTYRATSLRPNTEHLFRVKAVSELVYGSVYSTLGGLTLKETTLEASSGGSRRGTNSSVLTTPAPTDVTQPGTSSDSTAVRLDLAKDATVTKETTAEGKEVTKVVVNGERLVAVAAGKQVVELIVDAKDAIIEIPASALQALGSLTAIKIEVGGTTYTLPINVLGSLNKDDKVSIHIGTVSGQRLEGINGAIAGAKSEQLLPSPVEFNLTVGGQKVSDFKGVYVERKVKLQQAANPNQTTAVWIDDKNVLHFVPSVVNTTDGSSEVTIRSPHNSIYSVVRNNKSFDDLKGHWAQADVELLANKWIVNGQSEKVYNPETSVTRAEFTAMLVRSLGLLEEPSSAFADVPKDAWFAGAVGTAKKYGLNDGFEDGTFRPNDRITREQMAVMAVRALKTGGKQPAASAEKLTFTDNAAIGEWSRTAVSQLVSAKLINGMSDGSFAPKNDTTRAQAASVLKRILQHLSFIN